MAYLTRFLITYDTGSRQLWKEGANTVPLSWNENKILSRRGEQFAEFAESVRAGLCDYDYGSDEEGIRRLITLLRSRYGTLPDALRPS